MTKEECAAMFDGREYPFDPKSDEESQAKKDGLVIVYGASDDLMEFRGAIYDEIGAYEGVEALVTIKGIVPSHKTPCECQFCGFADYSKSARKIKANWTDGRYSWTYSTDIPHATFEIMEDGEKYCRGIVFKLKDVAAK